MGVVTHKTYVITLRGRLRLLQRLLYSRRLPVKLLFTVFRWRAQVLGGLGLNNTPPPKEKASASREEVAAFKGLPPPKPARLFNSMRSVGSFSSSDAGEVEYTHMNLLDYSGMDFADSSNEQEQADSREMCDAVGEKSTEGTHSYEKPPKLQVTMISTSRDSNGHMGNKSDATGQNAILNSELKENSPQTSEEERFIRLTFSPPAMASVRKTDSLDSEDMTFSFPDVPTGSESGIEVVEAEDPWDSIITKIKAVSNSDLPSDVKIQCMSHLLSQTARSEQPRSHTGETAVYQGASLQPQLRGSEVEARRASMLAFSQFQQDMAPTPGSEIRRHSSFAIASHARAYTRTQQEGVGSHAVTASQGTRGRQQAGAGSFPAIKPTEERPAFAVARLRHRLARSLMDLDELDQRSDSSEVSIHVPARQHASGRLHTHLDLPSLHRHSYQHESESSAASRLLARRDGSANINNGHVRQSRQDTDFTDRDRLVQRKASAASLLRRSYGGGLDTAHLQARSSPQSARIAVWRSYEDGLDDVTKYRPLPPKAPLQRRQLSASMESGLDESVQSAAQDSWRLAAPSGGEKSPYRWRQGIVEQYLNISPSKERRQSQEFLAPSFLKPFHSMQNLRQQNHTPARLNLFSDLRRDPDVRRGDHDTRTDSLSEDSVSGRRRLSLDRSVSFQLHVYL